MPVSISPGQRVLTLTSVRWSCLAFTVPENLIKAQKREETHASDLQSTGPPPARVPATTMATLSTICILGDMVRMMATASTHV